MDGFEVLPMARAAEIGDVFVTATGNKGVIRSEHMERMKDGAILANTPDTSTSRSTSRRFARWRARAARRVPSSRSSRSRTAAALPARGRAARQPRRGRRSRPRSWTCPLRTRRFQFIVENAASLERKVYDVPEEIDTEIARLKLATMGIEKDELTPEQEKYLASWDEGT